MKNWRRIHIYSFGYWRWLSTISALIIILIAVSGILLEHKTDFAFMEQTRVSTSYLPDSYAERLLQMRERQGTLEIYKNESLTVPLSWIVYDLHSGAFFGSWAPYFYDLIAVAMIVLSFTGIYMFLILKPKMKKRRTL